MKRKRRRLVTSLTLATVMLLSLVTPIQPNSSVLHSHAAYATPSDAETEQFASVETTKNDTEQTESIYMGDSYVVSFHIDSIWNNGYNASITIENTGDTTIENWCMAFPLSDEINNIWNARIEATYEDYIVVKNKGYNQDIPAGGSISFGITSYEKFDDFPESYAIIGRKVQTNSEDYSVDYIVKDIWDDGLVGEITITNHRKFTIEDWRLQFRSNLKINEIWGAHIEEQNEELYTLSCENYNQNISAESSITIGFKTEGIDFDLNDFVLYEYSTEESLDDVLDNETHVKDFCKDDIVYSENTGLIYIKNQVIISGVIGVDREVFEELADYLNADIVGYIEFSNDYQFEFRDELSEEELFNYVSYIDTFDFVNSASLNIVNMYESQAITNDSYYNDGNDDDWDEANPGGDNWGLEALRVLSAWDYDSELNEVSIGVFDTGFAVHEDLAYKKIKFNKDATTHGTHVTGVIAAKHNNKEGISGVCTKPIVYASSSSDIETSMQSREIYSYFIQNGTKVINVSLGYRGYMTFAASRGEEKALNYITTSSGIMEEFFYKMILAGYDFNIVTSASNDENDKFVYDENADYKYRPKEATDTDKEVLSGNVDAKYSSELTAITSEIVKSRIIVVGSMGYEKIDGKTSYYYSDFSNVGNRVDVCAPGEQILSTVPKSEDSSGYKALTGTSMASPYVAGIAGLIYQINPDISGNTVKSIIKNNSRLYISDNKGFSYGLPDASACVSASREQKNNNANNNSDYNSYGTYIKGFVEDIYGNELAEVGVSASKTNYGEGNLGPHLFSTCTDINGMYSLNTSDGVYSINFMATGYMPLALNNINVYPNKTTYVEKVKLQRWSKGYLTSKMSGKIIDALTGKNVENATIRLRKGWNNTEGKYVVGRTGSNLIYTTSSSGEFKFELAGGGYTLEVIKDGYITEYYNAIASPDIESESQIVVITPILPDNEMRIILTWDEIPKDLDSHLTFYKENNLKFHVYYNNKKAYMNNEKVAELDLDDTSSYGPETVTITLKTDILEDGKFSYSVHDYTNRNSSSSKSLSNSNASIKVYKGSEMLDTFRVQRNNIGTVWHVFDYDQNGLSLVDEYYNEKNPKEVD